MSVRRGGLGAAALVVWTLLLGATLVVEDEVPVTSLHPLYPRSMADVRAQTLVFDSLFYDSGVTSAPRSRLVENDTGTIQIYGQPAVRLRLREGIRWHDGAPLVPEDICFSVDALLNPKNPITHRQRFREELVGCEADPAARTVVVRYRSYPTDHLELLQFPVLPRHVFGGDTTLPPDSDFARAPVGTGPMRGRLDGGIASFAAVPSPHHRAQIDEVLIRLGGDPLVQSRRLLFRGVHAIPSVSPPLRPELNAADGVALRSYALRSWWFVALNVQHGVLARREVRAALNHALDRSALREFTWGPEGLDANPPCELISGPFPMYSPSYNRAVPVVKHADQAKVEEGMRAAGAVWRAGRWRVEGAPVHLRIGMHRALRLEAPDLLTQVANQLRAAGFETSTTYVDAVDWDRAFRAGELEGVDLAIGKWVVDPSMEVSPFFHSRAGGKGDLNVFRYANPAVDALFAEQGAARVSEELYTTRNRLHALLAEDLPYLFLWTLDTKTGQHTDVRGIVTPYAYFEEFGGWRWTAHHAAGGQVEGGLPP